MGDKQIKSLVPEKSQFFTAEKRMPQGVLSNVLRNVVRLDNSHSPVNCSSNNKAICSDIDRAIDINRVRQKKFNKKMTQEIEKLNTKPSESDSPQLSSNTPIQFRINPCNSQTIELPKIRKNFLIKRNREAKRNKNSRSVLDKRFSMEVVENLINKCNYLYKDIQKSRVLSVELEITQQNMGDFLLNNRNYERKLAENKYVNHIKKYISDTNEEIPDALTITKSPRKFWKRNHKRYISDICEELYMKE